MTTVRKYSYLILLVLVVILLWWFNRPQPPQVEVHTISKGNVEATITNTRTGTITACRRSHIVPVVSGRVDALSVKEGDSIEKGQLMLSLWNDDLKAQVSLAKSEANAAQARAEEACLTAELASKEARRARRMKEQELTSEELYDQAQNRAAAGKAACRAARASVEVAKAQVQVAEAALARTLLTAPFNGVVAEVNAELGEVLAPLTISGQTSSAVDLIEKGCLYISAPIDEIDAPNIEPGMPAYITLDAFPGRQFDGEVRRIAPYVLDLEKQARTVEVEVVFTDEEVQKRMLPGYSTDVEIVLDSKQGVLQLPTSALLRDNYVWVYRDGVVTREKVATGLNNWQITEITAGLEEGEQIILPGEVELAEGIQVRIKAAE